MAKKYLFVAEADKIQEMLFRFARQRQVLGGSRLLVKLGDDVENLARGYGGKALISRGGNFRLVFDTKDNIDAFGEKLSLFYRLLLDSEITIAGYEEYEENNSNSFKAANDKLLQKLRQYKQAERGRADEPHSPITAFCQDSGSGLASVHNILLSGETDTKYLSQAALDMGHAGGLGRYSQDQEDETELDDDFLSSISEKIENVPLKEFKWPQVPEQIGRLDRLHNNVAYLLADANGMGKIFDNCSDENELAKLSVTLDEVIRSAVAAPIPKLYNNLKELMIKPGQNEPEKLFPLLPLILAGDDVFILLPAFYALDYARQFCLEFQKLMRKELSENTLFRKLKEKIENNDLSYPTISAAVVFCKTKYPYHLAHQRGAALLNQAKNFTKTYAENNKQFPCLGFEIVIGNQLVKPAPPEPLRYVNSMNPFWLQTPSQPEIAKKSVALEKLLNSRFALKNMPRKRLAELREFFSPEHLPEDDDDTKWARRIQNWIARSKTVHTNTQWINALEKALAELGNGAANPEKPTSIEIVTWRDVDRHYGQKIRMHHGMPDLIEVWDYAQDLETPLRKYKEDIDETN